MNNKFRRFAVAVSMLLVASFARAATDWSAQDYDLFPGDFDGDGKTDVLYVAKSSANLSGIARSDGSAPNEAWQSWPGNYLGIQWYGGAYTVVVGDFNNDNKDDVLLQRNSAGDSYLLMTDNSGRLSSIAQAIGNSHLGLTWSKDQHNILAGDFNGDGRTDLFFQATVPTGTHAVVLADTYGTFSSGPTQTWTDSSWSAFKWSARNSVISVGDFNGDARSDLLIQRKPDIVMIDFEIPIPVPIYPPNSFGVVMSQGGSSPLQQVGVQQWSRNAFGVDWSPSLATAVIGDFNGDGRADVLLQGEGSGASYLLTGNSVGSAFSSSGVVTANVGIGSDAARLIAGNFDGSGGVGVYIQAVSPGGTNYSTNSVGTSITASTHSPSTVTGAVAASAVGSTPGSFAVDRNGAATYKIPIIVPPGINGVQPELALAYSSHADNGFLGVGWSLSGLSQITLCPATVDQDGFAEPLGRLCLDGTRLRQTNLAQYSVNYPYFQDGATYDTQQRSFSRVVKNGPGLSAYFTVHRKDGLIYEYGGTADSLIHRVGGTNTNPYAWLLSRVSDRAGNVMTFSYEEDGAPNGGFRPSEITYTSNSAAGVSPAYKVRFVWENRPASDYISSFAVGTLVRETKRLDRIETRYNNNVVRKYELSYQLSPTLRSRLASVQECAGSGECLPATVFSWQDGQNAWSVTQSIPGFDSQAAAAAHAIDIDGDGRTDLVHPKLNGGSRAWTIERSNGATLATAPYSIDAGSAAQIGRALPLPRSTGGGAVGLLLDYPQLSVNSIAFRGIMGPGSHTPAVPGPLSASYWSGDIDADGDVDVLYATSSGGTTNFFVHRTHTDGSLNSSAQQILSVSGSGFTNPDPSSGMRPADFNTDGRTDFLAQTVMTTCEDWGDDIGMLCVEEHVRIVLMSNNSGGYNAVELIRTYCGNYPGAFDCTTRRPIFAADFNGDRVTDVLNHDQAFDEWKLYLGTGTGLAEPQVVSMPLIAENASLAADFSNDGRADVLYLNSGVWQVAKSTGSAFEVTTPSMLPNGASLPRLMDVNGDGLVDLGYYYQGTFQIRTHEGPAADLLSSATDGVGNQVSITYAPVFDASVYTAGTAPFSTIGIQSVDIEIQAAPARMVVKEHRSTDGIGGTYTISQKYIGARKHTGSFGFLGFERREERDGRTGIIRNSSYLHTVGEPGYERQTMFFPYTARPARVWSTQSNGTMIRETLFDYEVVAEGGGEPPLVYSCGEGGAGCGAGADAIAGGADYRVFVYAKETIERTHEVDVGGVRNGILLSESKTTVNEVDGYGNATDVTTMIEDKDTVTLPATQRTFTTRVLQTISNDATNWCLGKASHVATTSTLGDGTSRTLRTAHTIDAAKCRVTDDFSAVDSSSNQTALSVHSHYEFATQACGSPSSVTVTGRRYDGTPLPARTTSFEYGAACFAPTKIKDPYLAEINRTYNYKFGTIDTETDRNNLTVDFDDDPFGRRIKETRPDGTSTTVAFAACNSANSYCGVSDLRTRVDTTYRDTSGTAISSSQSYLDSRSRIRMESAALPLTSEISYVVSTYDSLGRLATRSVPYTSGVPGRTVYEYDLIDRQRVAKLFDGSGTLVRQNKLRYEGRTVVATDPRNYETEKVFDVLGQVRKVKDPTSALYTTYAYTFSGNDLVSTVTDKAGNALTTRTNLIGYKTQTQDPDLGAWSFQHTSLGELTRQSDAKSQVLTYDDYDLLGRPTVRHEVEGDTSFQYGTAALRSYGQLRSISSNGYSELYNNDSYGRPASTQITIPNDAVYTTSYTYDPGTGLLDTMTYPASTGAHPLKLKYGYTKGVQTSVRDYTNNVLGTTYWQLTGMDAMWKTTAEQLGNGVTVVTGYDPTTGLMSVRRAGTDSGATNRQNFSYQWDESGNFRRRTDHNQANLYEHFYYDALNRLDYSTRNGTTNLDLQYNEIGNITNKSDVGAYTYTSGKPHAVTNAGSNVYTYDANGNMDSRPGATITWYSDNSVKKITQGAITSEFWYSPHGERFKQHAAFTAGTETTYYIGGVMEKAIVASGTAYRHYIGAGSNMVVHTRWSTGANQTFYATTDHQGSNSSITDQNASVVVTESFDAFGKRRGTNWTGLPTGSEMQAIAGATRRGYTSHEHLDNLDLIHMNGRVQDPTIGRFLSADPHIQAPEFSQSLNRYSYVWNNPLSMFDPTGFDGCLFGIADAGDGCKDPEWLEEITVAGERCDAQCRYDERMARYAQENLRMEQEIREQFFWDLARNTKTELWDKPVDNALQTWSDIKEGDLTAAGLGLLGIACDIGKACRGLERFAERVLGPIGKKALEVVKKIGCRCFVAGTLVVTSAGAQQIETLQIGDTVLARDELTGDTAYKPITDIYINDAGSVWELTILDSLGHRDVHRVTGTHPYWSLGQWVSVENLAVGDQLTTANGVVATVLAKRDTGFITRTYNLEVADFHSYFVGPQNVLVHNGCDDKPRMRVNDITRPGAKEPNYRIDWSKDKFEKHLTENGHTRTKSIQTADGEIRVYEKDGVKTYTLRDFSTSDRGATAEMFNGDGSRAAKIGFGAD